MVKVSVVIPFKDDNHLIGETIRRLNEDIDKSQVEIIIIDDGSFNTITESVYRDHPNVTVHFNKTNRGVGYSFDYGVNKAAGDVLLLMGSDVRVEPRKWLRDVLRLSYDYPNAIIASACKGMNEEWHMGSPDRTIRYGADLLFRVPEDRLAHGYKVDILSGHWLPEKRQDTIYDIPCLMGACYVTTKQWYHKIGGWGWLKYLDGRVGSVGMTGENLKWRGVRRWGGLEPHISLKTWLAGGEVKCDPTWETGHLFGRKEHVDKIRATKQDIIYFNKLYAAHSLMTTSQAKILNECLDIGGVQILNVNEARLRIKTNRVVIDRERDFFENIKVRDIDIFEERFGYDLKWLK